MANKIEHINATDTLNEGRVKLNRAIDDSNIARDKAESADIKSDEALSNSESTQTQLDTIVIDGDSSVEAAQARVDEKGVTHDTLKKRIDDGFEKTSSQLAETGLVVTRLTEVVVDVKSFGAIGDGVTDDTEAIQSAVNFLSLHGGGKLIIDAGAFKIGQTITLISNLHMEIRRNAILKKHNGGVMFDFPSHSKGYDGGLKNILIDGGGMLHGNLDNGNGVINSLHHTKGLIVRDIKFYECLGSSHVFDLCGSSDVLIEHCSFMGQKPVEGREYVEAIQIDYSSYKSLTTKNENERSNVDSLPTKNVRVRNCSFLPIYNEDGTIKYPAPIPMGGHTQVGFKRHSNLVFEYNTVVDVLPDQSSLTKQHRGIIKLSAVDGFRIYENRFYNTTGKNTRILGFVSNDWTTDPNQVHLDSPPSLQLNDDQLFSSKNITFERNTMVGFSGIADSAQSSPILFEGCKYDFGEMDNIVIKDNEFKGFFEDSQLNKPTSVGPDVIWLENVITSEISGNTAVGLRRFIYYHDSKHSIVRDNRIDKCDSHSISTSSSNSLLTLSLIDNVVTRSRGLCSVGADRLIIRGNTHDDDDTVPIVTSDRSRALIITTEKFLMSGNIITTENDLDEGVYIRPIDNSEGFISENIITGFNMRPINNPNEGIVVQ